VTDYLEPIDVEDLIASMGFHLRDRNLLLSALAAPLPVFGEEVYPSVHS
jgi:death-on-curing protein